ncbi:33 kDa chaperonin [compost metagenome]
MRYVVADYDTAGTMRGFCRFDPDEVAQASEGFTRPGARTLLGQGVFIMTIDRGEDFERTQGITPIEGESLSLCAEHYFTQSEQVPTKVRLAVGEVTTETGTGWRAGGAMIQVIAGDSARGSTEEVWERTRALFQTLGDDELIDPTISAETLLYRLFHEDGVRLEGAKALAAVCRCSKERLVTVMQSFPPEDRADMVEDDGMIHATCEYCSTVYKIDPQEIAS